MIGSQTDGALAEYLAVPTAKVPPLPDSLTWDQAALLEPPAVAIHWRASRFRWSP